jgi:hypothetical protein
MTPAFAAGLLFYVAFALVVAKAMSVNRITPDT